MTSSCSKSKYLKRNQPSLPLTRSRPNSSKTINFSQMLSGLVLNETKLSRGVIRLIIVIVIVIVVVIVIVIIMIGNMNPRPWLKVLGLKVKFMNQKYMQYVWLHSYRKTTYIEVFIFDSHIFVHSISISFASSYVSCERLDQLNFLTHQAQKRIIVSAKSFSWIHTTVSLKRYDLHSEFGTLLLSRDVPVILAADVILCFHVHFRRWRLINSYNNVLKIKKQDPLLLNWINFNLSMDK